MQTRIHFLHARIWTPLAHSICALAGFCAEPSRPASHLSIVFPLYPTELVGMEELCLLACFLVYAGRMFVSLCIHKHACFAMFEL